MITVTDQIISRLDNQLMTPHLVNRYMRTCDIFKPIPLTAEILEANGFRKLNEERFLLEDSEDKYWIKFYPKNTNYTGGVYDYIDLDCGCISIREMPIEFVHELQHALNLCEIDKEIKL